MNNIYKTNISTKANILDDLGKLIDDNAIDPVQYQYFKNLAKRKLVINDEITSDIIETAILPLLEWDNDGTNKPIEIILSTVGGSVYDGFALVSVIEKLKTPTTITVLSMAASMGIYLLMAGYNNNNITVQCYPFSIGLIHSGEQIISGTGTQVKDMFKFNERYEEKIKNFVLTHSKINEDLYGQIERQEFWMSAEDMLKYGIVNKIL